MKPIVHRSLSLVWAFACASTLGLLASCGGSNDAAVAVAPAQAGSAEIGPAGGSVTATFAGGATVTLVVPPHALATPTTIRIDPGVAPADALAAMTVSPAGLQFAVPATLSVVLPAGSDPSNTLVAFGIDDVRVPIGFVDATTRTMSVDLRYLGDGSQPSAAPAIGAAGGRAMIAAAGQHPDGSVVVASLQLFVMEGDLTSALVLWHALVGALASDGSRNNAIRVQEGFDALLDLPLDHAPQAVQSQIAADVITWRNVDCTQLSAARSALASFSFASDFNGYADRALDVLAFGKFTREMFDLAQQVKFVAPDACAALEADTAKPVRDSFQAYLDAAGAALNALSPVDDFDTLLNTRPRTTAELHGPIAGRGRRRRPRGEGAEACCGSNGAPARGRVHGLQDQPQPAQAAEPARQGARRRRIRAVVSVRPRRPDQRHRVLRHPDPLAGP